MQRELPAISNTCFPGMASAAMLTTCVKQANLWAEGERKSGSEESKALPSQTDGVHEA